eukprot:gene16870-20059_t
MDYADKLVAVTGASGYIASHIIQVLIDRGFRVRACVRDPLNQDKLEFLRSIGGAIEIVGGDLETADYASCFASCYAVIHTATPYIHTCANPLDDMVRPAVNGTLRVLEACALIDSIKHVVVTSSGGAVINTLNPKLIPKEVYNDDDWNTESTIDTTPYFYSKVQAEKAAWDFYQKNNLNPSSNHFKLSVCLPTFVIGPPLNSTLNTSLKLLINLFCRQQAPFMTRGGFVDVRDVALAHVLVLEAGSVSDGQRYILAGHVGQWKERPERPRDLEVLAKELNETIKPEKFNFGVTDHGVGCFASKRLELGDKILGVDPYACSLTDAAKGKICESCFKPATMLYCSRCKWVGYCSPECQRAGWPLHKAECTLYTETLKVNPGARITRTPTLIARIALKAQLQASGDINSSSGTIKMIEHLSEYKDPRPQFARNMFNMSLIAASFLLKKSITELVCEHKARILEKYAIRLGHNAFAISTQDKQEVGVAWKLTPHLRDRCMPNAIQIFNGAHCSLWPLYPIEQGEEIRISYIENTLPKHERFETLQDSFHFDCQCLKCLNTTTSYLCTACGDRVEVTGAASVAPCIACKKMHDARGLIDKAKKLNIDHDQLNANEFTPAQHMLNICDRAARLLHPRDPMFMNLFSMMRAYVSSKDFHIFVPFTKLVIQSYEYNFGVNHYNVADCLVEIAAREVYDDPVTLEQYLSRALSILEKFGGSQQAVELLAKTQAAKMGILKKKAIRRK